MNDALSDNYRQLLVTNRDILVQRMQLHEMWAKMRAARIITGADEELIKLNRTPREQVEMLIDHLERKTDAIIEKFCDCLVKSNQTHLVQYLRPGAPGPPKIKNRQITTLLNPKDE
ncbi:hypothetical protein CAPTEDRAFT_189558 [Capitella teleta]|uniref:CARD domain-containing protein n=1 Tax=Capitella teleta TaxID=283909 RepID=R7UGN7_CAPTE|nr:hypothetical protein CAPTEDRAFT_189558 [Capitella teleta]|eukprot:ELU05709.1 hypothetical protein CAPTEDRAFT_189558 [Capitella teleta]